MAAVDFSPQSQAIVDHACALAGQSHADLHVVHVDDSSRNGDVTRLGLERLASLLRPEEELELTTEKKVLRGIPQRALVEYAKSQAIDLIVMGTHGRKGLSHLTLGSVAERVLRNAPCPVQVLRSPQLAVKYLDQAAEILSENFAERLCGSRAETERQIRQIIVDGLRVTDTIAGNILHELQQCERAKWEPLSDDRGNWTFATGVEFVELNSTFQPSQSKSPAAELIHRAIMLRATDIHVDPVNHAESGVRLRIDGQLAEYCRLDREVTDHLVNQWKMMAGLDIAEPFRPKEGRVAFSRSAAEFQDIEARLTTVPVAGGEAVAMRLFSREDLFIPLEELGLSVTAMASVDEILRRAEELILVTGPTGSGKTTTVYSMLETISSSGKNIVSIEDPVEFPVPFVRQMEVDERHGITMTDGLKTILRMDPDVVFLGEIRDTPAAEIAMRAASSGRYVFSTLHTRDVASVITALRDLGLPDRSIAPNIFGIVNQRLMRRLCRSCCRPVEVTTQVRALLDRHSIEAPNQLYEAGRCSQCRETGYFGRIGVFEVIAMDAGIRSAISAGATESDLRGLFTDRGMVSLNADALAKVAGGITDLDEAMRVRWLV
jgi:type II secretory ATPase GspE/PulE/Tfp pilus assembly ATPase PilB-like protein/nucleotide-binding universal stress UspA family protein